jgi:hypothetical protein
VVQGAAPPPADLQTLIGAFTPHAAVEAFVWAVLVRLVPPSLLDPGLRLAVRRLVGLRRHQPMSLHAALRGLPLLASPALLPHGGDTTRRETPSTGARVRE